MNVLIPLAEGVEDMEAAILIDVFRRAGWRVTTVGMTEGLIRGARGIRMAPDAFWPEIHPEGFDLMVLPGGKGGVENLRRHSDLRDALQRAQAAGKWICALCAGPLVLVDAGLLTGRRATCYPGLELGVTGPIWLRDRVVIDGNLVTSQGPGTCFEFALAIIEKLEGAAKAKALAAELLLKTDS